MSLCKYNPNETCDKSGPASICTNCILDKVKDDIRLKYGFCDICRTYDDGEVHGRVAVGRVTDLLDIIDSHKVRAVDNSKTKVEEEQWE